jgi:hypothetical protein
MWLFRVLDGSRFRPRMVERLIPVTVIFSRALAGSYRLGMDST